MCLRRLPGEDVRWDFVLQGIEVATSTSISAAGVYRA